MPAPPACLSDPLPWALPSHPPLPLIPQKATPHRVSYIWRTQLPSVGFSWTTSPFFQHFFFFPRSSSPGFLTFTSFVPVRVCTFSIVLFCQTCLHECVYVNTALTCFPFLQQWPRQLVILGSSEFKVCHIYKCQPENPELKRSGLWLTPINLSAFYIRFILHMGVYQMYNGGDTDLRSTPSLCVSCMTRLNIGITV